MTSELWYNTYNTQIQDLEGTQEHASISHPFYTPSVLLTSKLGSTKKSPPSAVLISLLTNSLAQLPLLIKSMSLPSGIHVETCYITIESALF